MGRQVICPYCKEKLDKDEAHPYKKRYYHEKCFNEWQAHSQHRKDLIAYICELHNLDAPTGMILKQIKEFENDYGYKLKGMELALRYFYETLGNPVREGDGIGIIPYVYEEAKKYYILRMKAQESAEENEGNYVTSRKVKITSPKLDYKKRVKPIDIASL